MWAIVGDRHVHVHELFYLEFYCGHIFEDIHTVIIYFENFM